MLRTVFPYSKPVAMVMDVEMPITAFSSGVQGHKCYAKFPVKFCRGAPSPSTMKAVARPHGDSWAITALRIHGPHDGATLFRVSRPRVACNCQKNGLAVSGPQIRSILSNDDLLLIASALVNGWMADHSGRYHTNHLM